MKINIITRASDGRAGQINKAVASSAVTVTGFLCSPCHTSLDLETRTRLELETMWFSQPFLKSRPFLLLNYNAIETSSTPA